MNSAAEELPKKESAFLRLFPRRDVQTKTAKQQAQPKKTLPKKTQVQKQSKPSIALMAIIKILRSQCVKLNDVLSNFNVELNEFDSDAFEFLDRIDDFRERVGSLHDLQAQLNGLKKKAHAQVDMLDLFQEQIDELTELSSQFDSIEDQMGDKLNKIIEVRARDARLLKLANKLDDAAEVEKIDRRKLVLT